MTRHFNSFAFALAFAWAWPANGQGTLETPNPLLPNQPIIFTAHLTGNTDYTGDGTFSLTGNRLTYEVISPYGFDTAGIYGPTLSESDGLIFTLEMTTCMAPLPNGTLGFCLYSGRPAGTGALTLTDGQVSYLVNGSLYVRATSSSAPSFPIQGQILQVPEPSVGTLTVFLFACCLIVHRWRRNRANDGVG